MSRHDGVRAGFIVIVSLLVVVVGAILTNHIWLAEFDSKAEVVTRNVAGEIGNHLAHDVPIREAMYRDLIQDEPEIGYVVVADYRSGYKSGAINSTKLETGGGDVLRFLESHGDEATIAHLLKKSQGFPGKNLSVIAATLVPPKQASDQTPFGTIKIAYVVPGHPFGQGYIELAWYALGFLSFISLFSVVHVYVRKRKYRHGDNAFQTSLSTSEYDEDLKELDDALDDDTTRVIDEFGREWKILFDGKTMEGWKKQGDWYITERELAGQPWGASIVQEEVGNDSVYYFQIRAKKVAGPDGFLILFTCGEHSLCWVIGGWGNTRSEVAGFENTQSKIELEKFTWYKLEVRMEEDRAEGLINDQVVWSLPRTSITISSPELGFQKGIGIAVWNTFAKFKEVRYLAI